jgi:Sterol carrier protein domain
MDVASTPSAIESAKANESRLVFAHASDHAPIHALLRAVNQSPSAEDFLTWLDEPSYEPTDRLLLQHGDQIIAHVQLLQRMAWFGGVKIRVGSLQDLAVLPEYAQADCERKLLTVAERQLHEAQSVVGLVRTDRPEPFRAAGWTVVRGQGHSEVSTRDMLAHLSAQAALTSRHSHSLHIRRWRHVEMESVRFVYTEWASHGWGAVHRPEAYWQWLVGRKAHSDLIVAVAGADQWEETQSDSRIVGYAVTAGDKVLELCCLGDYARAAPRLMVRACQDAIEQDHHTLSLHTPATDPLHELLVTAGGTWRGEDRGAGGALLVKLHSPSRWVEAIFPILRRRAKQAAIPRPFQIGFDCGVEKYRLLVTRRSSRLQSDEAADVDVRCDAATLDDLLVGNLNIAKAHESGRLQVADDAALQRLAALFSPAIFWQSQLDVRRF